MDISISGSGTITGDWSELFEMAESHWSVELARLKEISMITGDEVIYDLTMFDEDWSPVYHHSSDDPVAWVNSKTGERVDGADHPNAT
ncbi:hypothetical protein [Devosia alba]|uniref:hypothetical protein n=1 Tax=Devosia alba TaxID=3152360 RepID=UPI003265C671